jgi:hypothetical protein
MSVCRVSVYCELSIVNCYGNCYCHCTVLYELYEMKCKVSVYYSL